MLRDLLHALRLMRRNPVFAVTAVLSLALAIGGNTAMFTVIRSVLLKPLEYPNADRLVSISGGATPARFEMIRAEQRSFAAVGAHTFRETFTLSGDREPEVLRAVRISAGFLKILGIRPILGRDFRSDEDAPGGTPVVLISSGLWQRRFASDEHIVAKTATLESVPC